MRKTLYILMVWLAVCQTFAQQDLLPRQLLLDSLKNGNVCSVQIPDSLEPDAVMNFYVGVKGQMPKGGYPVFLYLHGSGPREQEWQTGLKLAQYFNDAPCMYIIPEIPQEGEWYRWWQRGKQWVWQRLLTELLDMKEVNPARLYVYGISEGGYGSQRLASYYADYLAAAGPMAGGEPLKNAPVENLGHVAFSFLTGEKDQMFFRYKLTKVTGEKLDSMQRLYPEEYIHRVELQPGRGHAIDYRPTTPWLSKYSRTAQPKHFIWENYEMDGVKRNCFYNLEIIGENGKNRRQYEMSITKNRIDIKASDVEYETTWQDPYWHIDMMFQKKLCPAPHGRLRVYLSPELVDVNKAVTIRINGKKVFRSKVDACEDCAHRANELWHDPLRKFDRSVEIGW